MSDEGYLTTKHGDNTQKFSVPDDAEPIKHCQCCKYYGLSDNRSLGELLTIYDTHDPIQGSSRPVSKELVIESSERRHALFDSDSESSDSEKQYTVDERQANIFDLDLNGVTVANWSNNSQSSFNMNSSSNTTDALPEEIMYDFHINRSSKENGLAYKSQKDEVTSLRCTLSAHANNCHNSNFDHQREIFEHLIEVSASNSDTIKRRGSNRGQSESSELKNEVFGSQESMPSLKTNEKGGERSHECTSLRKTKPGVRQEIEAFEVPDVNLRHVEPPIKESTPVSRDSEQFQHRSIGSLVHLFEQKAGNTSHDHPRKCGKKVMGEPPKPVVVHAQEKHAEQKSDELVKVEPPKRMETVDEDNPSVVADDDFKSVDDVSALRKAMKGLGTDEKTLINIICRRTNAQLKEIQCKYTIQFGRDLFKDVRSETSGNFREVLCALLMPRQLFYTNQLHEAFAVLGTNEDTLIDLMCTLSYSELQDVQANYMSYNNQRLEEDIASYTSGLFRSLLVSLCVVKRDDGPIDSAQLLQDISDIMDWPTNRRSGVDEYLFNQILTQRSYAHIRAINEYCLNEKNEALLDVIQKHFRGDVKNALSAIVMYSLDRPYFFATRLHKSMAGLGTADSQLIRVMVMRSEIDLAKVAAVFETIYNETLAACIKGDTSGDYRRALLTLLGNI